MRIIGHLENESQARTFADFLYVQGIENQLELQKGEGWAIWVRDEDRISGATDLLSEFRKNPDLPRYREEAKSAEKLRAVEEKAQQEYRKRQRDGRQLFRPFTVYGMGPLTLVLIAASVVVFLLSQKSYGPIHSLFISEYVGGNRDWGAMLPEVRHGQIWRLFTPVLIHMDVWHILFNMLCLRDLGSMIEGRQGTLQLALLVIVIAGLSNFGQYYMSGPLFGGMSGVVYGLLGYVWIRGNLDPGSGLFLHPTTVMMMLVWFVLCFTPLLGHIANTVHTVGLVVGMAWGFLSSLRHR